MSGEGEKEREGAVLDGQTRPYRRPFPYPRLRKSQTKLSVTSFVSTGRNPVSPTETSIFPFLYSEGGGEEVKGKQEVYSHSLERWCTLTEPGKEGNMCGKILKFG